MNPPNFEQPFILELDTCEYGLSIAAMIQISIQLRISSDGVLCHICFK